MAIYAFARYRGSPEVALFVPVMLTSVLVIIVLGYKKGWEIARRIALYNKLFPEVKTRQAVVFRIPVRFNVWRFSSSIFWQEGLILTNS
jgi:hypothetical protein